MAKGGKHGEPSAAVAGGIVLDAERSDPRLGGTVYFTIDPALYEGKASGTLRRVEVKAYQDHNDSGYTLAPADDQCPDGFMLTYGEAGTIEDGYLLGGGGSAWLAQGGPAHIVANAFFFDNSGPEQLYVRLASTEFEAAG